MQCVRLRPMWNGCLDGRQHDRSVGPPIAAQRGGLCGEGAVRAARAQYGRGNARYWMMGPRLTLPMRKRRGFLRGMHSGALYSQGVSQTPPSPSPEGLWLLDVMVRRILLTSGLDDAIHFTSPPIARDNRRYIQLSSAIGNLRRQSFASRRAPYIPIPEGRGFTARWIIKLFAIFLLHGVMAS